MNKPSIVHPFLFGLFPIVALYSQNVGYTPWREVVAPVAVASVVVALTWLAAKRVVRSTERAAVLTSAIVVVGFFHRAVHDTIQGFELVSPFIASHRAIFAIEALALASIAWMLRKSSSDCVRLSRNLDVVALALLAIPFGSIVFSEIRAGTNPEPSNVPSVVATETGQKPDVYFIVLDEYTRSDVLLALFDFDNRTFIQALEDRGFFVADQSFSNYPHTLASLAATLNMQYLDQLGEQTSDRTNPFSWLSKLLRENAVAEILRTNFGYRFVAFASGFGLSDVTNADVFYRRSPLGLSEFAGGVLSLTVAPELLEAVPLTSMYEGHRKDIEYIFNSLPEIAELDEPTFTFAHILAPHGPFVFDEDGDPRTPAYHARHKWQTELNTEPDFAKGQRLYREAYQAQARFVNRRVIEVIDSILRRSETAPIIVLQGDHGTQSTLNPHKAELGSPDAEWTPLQRWERFSILNAILLPEANPGDIDPGITPVNTFRLILDASFGTQLGLLPDKAFWMSYDRPRRYFEVGDVGTRPTIPRLD